MKRILILLVMLFVMVVLSWGCTGLTGEIGATGLTGLTGENGIDYIPSEELEAVVTLTNWVQGSYLNNNVKVWDWVYLNYTIENIGLINIDYYEITIIIDTIEGEYIIYNIAGSDILIGITIESGKGLSTYGQEADFVAIIDYNLFVIDSSIE